MINDPYVVFSRAKVGSPEAFAVLVAALHRDLRIFLAGYSISPKFLDAAELAVWESIWDRLATCPSDPTAAGWARHLANSMLQRMLTREDQRAIAVKDAIGHTLVQETLQALAADGVEHALPIRVGTRFARLAENSRQLLIHRTAGEALTSLVQGRHGDESDVASILCAARAGLINNNDDAIPQIDPRVCLLIERHLDGSISREESADLNALVTGNLQISSSLAIQVRSHLILVAQLRPRGDDAVRAIIKRSEARSSDQRSSESSVLITAGPTRQMRLRPSSQPAISVDQGFGGGKSIALFGIVGTFLLAVILMVANHSANSTTSRNAPGNKISDEIEPSTNNSLAEPRAVVKENSIPIATSSKPPAQLPGTIESLRQQSSTPAEHLIPLQAITFEDQAPGSRPNKFHIYLDPSAPSAGVSVVEGDAFAGHRMVAMINVAGKKKPWTPEMAYPIDISAGVAQISVALRVPVNGMLSHHWRQINEDKSIIIGPQIAIDGSGNFTVNQQVLGNQPPGSWVQYTITCGLGSKANGTWKLRVQGKNEARVHEYTDLTYNRAFTKLNWLNFSCNGTETSTMYIGSLMIGMISGLP
jgi:hypothetical protein